MVEKIPLDIALKLRKRIRQENRSRWYSFYGMWCWGCYRFTNGDPNRLCFSSRTDNRGCTQVNKRYDSAKVAE